VLTGHLVRVAALAVSAMTHVLVYGALSLAPAWSPPPRTVMIAELIVTEPPPIAASPRLITPPRPLVRPRPPKTPVEAPPAAPPKPEPQVEQNVPEPPTPPPMVAAAEPAREAIEAPPAPTQTAPTAPTPPPAVTTPPARTTTPAPASPSVTMLSHTGSAAIAALPPAPPVTAPGPLTRTAIPRGGYQVTPSYPATARRLGIEGTALLRVFVDTDGRVGDVVVKHSAGHPDLDRAAADAVRRWRFEPARRGAETVAMWVELPVEFHLR
jgi:protein TonB